MSTCEEAHQRFDIVFVGGHGDVVNACGSKGFVEFAAVRLKPVTVCFSHTAATRIEPPFVAGFGVAHSHQSHAR